MESLVKRTLLTLCCLLTVTLLTSCGYYEARANRAKLSAIRIGMTKAEVLKIMGKPPAGVFQTDKIIFYYTNPQWYDGCVTRDECCPFVFAKHEDRLIGFGQDYYRNNITLPDWERQKIQTRKRDN